MQVPCASPPTSAKKRSNDENARCEAHRGASAGGLGGAVLAPSRAGRRSGMRIRSLMRLSGAVASAVVFWLGQATPIPS
jgi:hypothetical protein